MAMLQQPEKPSDGALNLAAGQYIHVKTSARRERGASRRDEGAIRGGSRKASREARAHG